MGNAVFARFSILAVTSLAAVACGPGGGGDAGMDVVAGSLSGEGPFLAAAAGNVRQIVITNYAAQTQAGEAARCALRADLFDATLPRTLDVMGTEGECRMYSGSSNLALTSQHWVCAGAINVTYPGREEHVGACRAAGSTVPEEATRRDSMIECAGLTAGTAIQVTSVDEIGAEDVVRDLDTSVTLPTAVAITMPTDLGVFTWPESGDMQVRWTSANAQSAVVTVEVRNPTGPTSTIVCQPRTNGQVTIPAVLIQQANFRMTDALVRVGSYRDVSVTAETDKTYRVYAGFSSALLLQARR